jgi:hypothetical protein
MSNRLCHTVELPYSRYHSHHITSHLWDGLAAVCSAGRVECMLSDQRLVLFYPADLHLSNVYIGMSESYITRPMLCLGSTIMLKVSVQRLSILCILLGALISSLSFIYEQSLPAFADGSQLVLSQPGTNAGAVGGQVGTKIHLYGTGFPASATISLYATVNNDPLKCRDREPPAGPGLTPFTPSMVLTQADGTFTLDTTWPSSASSIGASYYVCAVAHLLGKLSSNTFTVTPPPTISLSTTSVAPGGQVTITGTNWYPPQLLTVTIADATGTALVTGTTTPDQNGALSIILTIPPNAQAGPYSVGIAANNDLSLKSNQSNALTITGNTTPTPAASPSPAATSTASSTPVATTSTIPSANTGSIDTTNSVGTSGSNTMINFLPFTMGGLGILLVLVGILLFVMYSRGQ